MSKKSKINQNFEIRIISTDDVVRRGGRSISTVAFEKVKIEMSQFCIGMQNIFDDLKLTSKGFELEEVTMEAEISSDGKISLLGSGVSLGAKGTISFKFIRKK
jgi:hypothetical protein